MKKIKLSPRLMTIASLCSESDFYADVGTDHAFIPIYLAQKHKNSRIFASDLRKGPIETAKANAETYGVSEQIEFFCADGLDFPGAELAKTIIISGMGGETIINIIDNAKWCREASEVIVQPQSKIRELLDYMFENNFKVLDAKLVSEKERLYLVIKYGGVGKNNIFKSVEEVLYENSDPLLEKWLYIKREKAEKIFEAQKKARTDNKEVKCI